MRENFQELACINRLEDNVNSPPFYFFRYPSIPVMYIYQTVNHDISSVGAIF